MITVWKWKANVLDWKDKPGVLGIGTLAEFVEPLDPSLFGRSGWVAFAEDDPPRKYTAEDYGRTLRRDLTSRAFRDIIES